MTGASLRPSPTIATRWPAACSAATAASLSAGLASPRARATPSSRATASTRAVASPESSSIARPEARSALDAGARVGAQDLGEAEAREGAVGSAEPGLGTGVARVPRRPDARFVGRPGEGAEAIAPAIAGVRLDAEPGLLCDTDQRDRRRHGRRLRGERGRERMRRRRAEHAGERAHGRLVDPGAPRRRLQLDARSTSGPGSVSVPVLSKQIVSSAASASSASKRCTSTPRRTSAPAAASSAEGAASESAHGQVTISTETATQTARDGSMKDHAAAAARGEHQHAPEERAGDAVGGAQQRRPIGHRRPHQARRCLRSACRRRCGRRAGRPAPRRLMLPAMASSPQRLATGRDSPVSKRLVGLGRRLRAARRRRETPRRRGRGRGRRAQAMDRDQARRAVVGEAAHDRRQARQRALERGGDAVAHLEREVAPAEQEADEHRQRIEVRLGAEHAAGREGGAAADDEGEGDADRDRQVHADAAAGAGPARRRGTSAPPRKRRPGC